jgi:DNA-directed RNA polymerase subunit M/transcription elongation factor TFIIS
MLKLNHWNIKNKKEKNHTSFWKCQKCHNRWLFKQ